MAAAAVGKSGWLAVVARHEQTMQRRREEKQRGVRFDTG